MIASLSITRFFVAKDEKSGKTAKWCCCRSRTRDLSLSILARVDARLRPIACTWRSRKKSEANLLWKQAISEDATLTERARNWLDVGSSYAKRRWLGRRGDVSARVPHLDYTDVWIHRLRTSKCSSRAMNSSFPVPCVLHTGTSAEEYNVDVSPSTGSILSYPS